MLCKLEDLQMVLGSTYEYRKVECKICKRSSPEVFFVVSSPFSTYEEGIASDEASKKLVFEEAISTFPVLKLKAEQNAKSSCN